MLFVSDDGHARFLDASLVLKGAKSEYRVLESNIEQLLLFIHQVNQEKVVRVNRVLASKSLITLSP